MFVDSSALVAMIAPEPDGKELADKLGDATERMTSPYVISETVLALRRIMQAPMSQLIVDVVEFLARSDGRSWRCGQISTSAY